MDVVVGIIFRGNKFLIEKRKKDESRDPGIVCLPGGHVETGEAKEETLIREMKEELGIIVKKLKFIKKDFWTASDGKKQNIYYYIILEYNGKPVCKTAKEIKWLSNTEEIDIKADRDIVEELRAKMPPTGFEPAAF